MLDCVGTKVQTILRQWGCLGQDLQNWLKVYVSENGIILLFDFSPLDLTCLDSNVILISLETFSNH
jgi:hypothetical protein